MKGERNREWVDCEVEPKKKNVFFLIKFYFRKNNIKMNFNSLKKIKKDSSMFLRLCTLPCK